MGRRLGRRWLLRVILFLALRLREDAGAEDEAGPENGRAALQWAHRLRHEDDQDWRHHAPLGRIPYFLRPDRSTCDDHFDHARPAEEDVEGHGFVAKFALVFI